MSELRTLAEAATPGPWHLVPIPRRTFSWVASPQGWIGVAYAERDAAYIAAFPPDVALALLDERDALRAALERLYDVRELSVGAMDRKYGVQSDHIEAAQHIARAALKDTWQVHNHGPEEGRGLACREYRLNGRLIGACKIEEATGHE